MVLLVAYVDTKLWKGSAGQKRTKISNALLIKEMWMDRLFFREDFYPQLRRLDLQLLTVTHNRVIKICE